MGENQDKPPPPQKRKRLGLFLLSNIFRVQLALIRHKELVQFRVPEKNQLFFLYPWINSFLRVPVLDPLLLLLLLVLSNPRLTRSSQSGRRMIQTPDSSFRTHWTPAMDRYFIELMLEEVQKGSRIDDHLFSKRAWTNMTMLFNSKFGSQYDKDVLKNRHKTLRKQYKTVRNLLDQSGFSWDETLQMVIANDDVWDNYSKAHPYARSYRTKTVPYYSDLCIIYKNEVDDVVQDSNLNNDSVEIKIGGLLGSPNSAVTLAAHEVQESLSLLYDQQSMQQFPMSSTSEQSSDQSSECDPIMKVSGSLDVPNCTAPTDAHEDPIDNVVESTNPLISQFRCIDESMGDYPGMKIGSLDESSDSLAFYGDQIDCVLEPSVSNVEAEISYKHNMDQLLMPSTFELSSNSEGMLDIQGFRIGEGLEGPESPILALAHGDQIDNVQEPPGHLDGDADTSNDQNKQQLVISSVPKPSPDKCTVNAVHETTISAENKANGNSISAGDGNDGLHGVPDIANNTSNNRCRTSWSPPMDRYFIDLMLDQVHKGNMIDGACRKQAWKHMIALFNMKFGFNYDTEILKNRYKTLRKHYNAVKRLLDQPGFLWDDSKQMVTADNFVWHDYIKTHPDAGQYRTRIIPYYNDLCLIYKDAAVDGRYSFSGRDIDLTDISATKNGESLVDLQSPTATTSVAHEVPVFSGEKDLYDNDQQKKRRFETPLKTSSKKLMISCERNMEDALREMATVVYSLVEEKKQDANSSSIENVIHALQALPDIDDELLLDACDFLEDEKKAKTFMALDSTLRKKWLIRKLSK